MDKNTVDFDCLSSEEQLALLKRLKNRAKPNKNKVKNEEKELATEFPLSFSQQRLWTLSQLDEQNLAAYNIPAAIKITGEIDLKAISLAFNEVVKKHDALRLKLMVKEGKPYQSATEASFFDIPLVNLASNEVNAWLKGEARHIFKLDKEKLYRVQLLCTNNTEHILLMNFHHLVFDGWSMDIFKRDFIQAYDQQVKTGHISLVPLSAQYDSYVEGQRSYLLSEQRQIDLDYWQNKLKGCNNLIELPCDFARPPTQSFVGKKHSFVLNATLAEQVKQLAQSRNASLFMTYLSAFKLLLARYSGQYDVSIGTAVANRQDAKFADQIGFFANTLVLRDQLSATSSFYEVLECVKSTSLEAMSHQALPFETLLEKINLPRSLSYSPLFQVMFVMQDIIDSNRVSLNGLTFEEIAIDNETSKFDLLLFIYLRDGKVTLNIEYCSDLFKA
ncbi:condensation domain-containing protein, partial [Pseudoalteromonas luteoviolacea]|uniref:condensation domain-containing protein n=1 Tax=Pseudoalteromonas luteoviolacea TaxID=43657 RepID=UPI000A4FF532